jgi:hypothetical protein
MNECIPMLTHVHRTRLAWIHSPAVRDFPDAMSWLGLLRCGREPGFPRKA